MTHVVHCKKEVYNILIDRTTKWGNPFVIGKDGNRLDVISKYKEWLDVWIINNKKVVIRGYSNKWVCEHLYLLKDKILACWCKPKSCHGDVLIELINNPGIMII